MKKQSHLLGITSLTLLIPAISMQFTDEVNWGIMDFVVAGILIYSCIFAIQFISIKVRSPIGKPLGVLCIILIFALIWAQLAVDIF